jgi:hypothetical protein
MNDEEMIWESYINKIMKDSVDYEKDLDPEIEAYAKTKGYTIEAYHGSKEKELTQISKMRTSYGLFFSPDPVTSSGYSGDDGKIYHVLLYAPDDKILNLTDDLTRFKFFNEQMGSGNYQIVSKRQNNYGEYNVLDDKSITKTIVDSLKTHPEILDYIIKKYSDEMDKEEILEYVEDIINDDAYDLIDEPIIWKLFEDDYHKMDEEVNNLLNAYGSENFYLNYQDNVLKTANHLGYLLVILDDPATLAGGESVSYVVFDPVNIKLADSQTFDSKGNEIPLQKRFNRNISDIRY